MTRTKEVEPGSGKIPDYKSPSARLVHCLRQGYDNARLKLANARNKIKFYQIKTRDLEKSRGKYKKQVITLEEKIAQLEKENKLLKNDIKKMSKKKTK
jgi:septal ring factor EnvC (AmiA/AmiB activator)